VEEAGQADLVSLSAVRGSRGTHRRRWPVLAVTAMTWLLSTGARPVTSIRASRHDIHVTQSRVVIENGTVLWRVRCFADDLEKSLRAFSNRPAFALESDRSADSIVTAYFNAKVRVDADGKRLSARLLQSSSERDPAGGGVQIYVLQLNAATQPRSMTVRNALMFEQFPTEQNLVILLAMPGERRRSLFFAATDDVAQTVTF
jgi:hypothetical protein